MSIGRLRVLTIALVSAGCVIIVGGVLLLIPHHSSAPPTGKLPTRIPLSDNAFPDSSSAGVIPGAHLVRVPADRTDGAGWRWTGSTVQILNDNAVLNGLDITGSVQSKFAHLTMTNSRVRCVAERDWCVNLSANSTLTDVEIGGGANGVTFTQAIGVYSGGPASVLDRVDIHHVSDGLRVDGGTTVRDSYIHDLVMAEFPDTHSDGSQTTAGSSPIVFQRNHIVAGNNDGIFLQAGASVVVDRNLIDADNRENQVSSYGIGGGGAHVTGPISFTNNVFSRGWQVRPIELDAWPAGTRIAGNTYVDGAAVETGS